MFVVFCKINYNANINVFHKPEQIIELINVNLNAIQ
jgi:hypothetical protein